MGPQCLWPQTKFMWKWISLMILCLTKGAFTLQHKWRQALKGWWHFFGITLMHLRVLNSQDFYFCSLLDFIDECIWGNVLVWSGQWCKWSIIAKMLVVIPLLQKNWRWWRCCGDHAYPRCFACVVVVIGVLNVDYE
jgi:hypothetical protein